MKKMSLLVLLLCSASCSDVISPAEAEEQSNLQRIQQLEEHVGDLLNVVNVLAGRTTVSDVTYHLVQESDEATLPSSVEVVVSCPNQSSRQIEETCSCGGDLAEGLLTGSSEVDNATGDLTCGCSPVHVTSTGTINVVGTLRCLGIRKEGPDTFVNNGDLPLGFDFEVSAESD